MLHYSTRIKSKVSSGDSFFNLLSKYSWTKHFSQSKRLKKNTLKFSCWLCLYCCSRSLRYFDALFNLLFLNFQLFRPLYGFFGNLSSLILQLFFWQCKVPLRISFFCSWEVRNGHWCFDKRMDLQSLLILKVAWRPTWISKLDYQPEGRTNF